MRAGLLAAASLALLACVSDDGYVWQCVIVGSTPVPAERAQ